MAFNYPLIADTVADLIGNVLPDGWSYKLLGNSVKFDQPPVWYVYDAFSTATADGVNVIQPTMVTGAGRYIKRADSYNNLTDRPTIPNAQIQSDWNQSSSGALDFIKNKPAVAAPQQAFEGTTKRTNAFPIFLSGSVASGVVAFNLTTDGTSGGTPIFPNGVITDSVNLIVNDATAAYQMAAAFSNANKTLTITANKLTTASLLTGLLGQGQANGSIVKVTVWGY